MRHIRPAVLAFALLLVSVLPAAAQIGYVVNGAYAGFVSFIDAGTNTIVTGPVNTVLVEHQPIYAVLSSDNHYLYVSNLYCNYADTIQGCVSVIRTDALATSPTVNIPVGHFPRGIAITPDGTRLYVVNTGDSTISVIDTSTETVIATIPSVQAHLEIVMSPDGTRAYVPGYLNGEGVIVIDTATNSVIGSLVGLDTNPLFGRPDPIYGIAITPDGQRLYVANGNLVDLTGNYVGSNMVTAIDIASNRRVATLSVARQPWDIAITPDGSKAYVATFDNTSNQSGTLTAIDTATNTVLTAIDTDCCLSVPAISPDGAKVFVSNTRYPDYGIEVFSTVTNTQIATIANDPPLYPSQFSYPQGIVFAHTAQTPAQMVTSLITELSDPTLGLTAGQTNSLADKLNNALLSIQQGLMTQAINQLDAFINSVKSSLKTGKISAQTANTLVAAANAIIALLQPA